MSVEIFAQFHLFKFAPVGTIGLSLYSHETLKWLPATGGIAWTYWGACPRRDIILIVTFINTHEINTTLVKQLSISTHQTIDGHDDPGRNITFNFELISRQVNDLVGFLDFIQS